VKINIKNAAIGENWSRHFVDILPNAPDSAADAAILLTKLPSANDLSGTEAAGHQAVFALTADAQVIKHILHWLTCHILENGKVRI
jgi:hypothetical protein